ncbi:ATP-binding protein [Chitinophaga sp.]|uniref:sensor histidine kinase n=1 Tax=Chitinophaga sp. TaxID=1869181 RepID=UPI00261A0E7E|nr:ATP-binding protein [uncultured Chitinophaga sp.]
MTRLRLKTKIAAGVLFLFAMLLLVGVMGYFYLDKVNRAAASILEDNYESVEYAGAMLRAAEHWNGSDSLRRQFVSALEKQEKNTTEPGEAAFTKALRADYEAFAAGDTSRLPAIREHISGIMDVNLKAIVSKQEKTRKTADKALVYIALVSGFCCLIGIVFVYNFPGYIANPIRELTEGIRQIADKKYEQRLHFRSGDEFGELAEAFNTMARKLDEYEHSSLARILFEKQRAEAVIGSLKDATIGLDNKNIILFANAEALQLLNLPENGLVGKPADEAARHNDLLRYLLHDKNPAPVKIVAEGKENFFLREFADIIHNSEVIGHIIVLRNITTFKEQDLAKTHFIATISHELKTPLAATDLSLKLLDDDRTGPLSSGQRELLEGIREDNRRMIRMVSELLDFSRVESGNIALQVQAVPLADILQYALQTVARQAAGKEVGIRTEIPDTAAPVLADAEKSAWVLVNLLTNAIRYSPPNSEVEMTVQEEEKMWRFGVRDHGKGIDAGFREKIFERFFRVPEAEGGKGTGLGLAIAREFIEAQGGSIGVESEPGKGSYFWFRLPKA